MPEKPYKIAIAGTGGYARSHHRAVLHLEQRGLVKLIATCDPNKTYLHTAINDYGLDKRCVCLYTSLDELLLETTKELDLITLPIPLPLHSAMHAQCVEAKVPIYLEKPPTLYPPELEQMLEVEKSAKTATAVGFNYIYEGNRRELKERITAGEFGPLKNVNFLGHWPRPPTYYSRTNWAAKLFAKGYPVLDSPAGNAFAHFIHNLLYWAGPTINEWAKPEYVSSKYYRSRDIESADIAFINCQLSTGGIQLRAALSHTWTPKLKQTEQLIFEDHAILYDIETGYKIYHKDKCIEEGSKESKHALEHNLLTACERAIDRQKPYSTLKDSLAFVHLQAMALIATNGIQKLNPDCLLHNSKNPAFEGTPIISELEQQMQAFLRTGLFPKLGHEPKEQLKKISKHVDFKVEFEKLLATCFAETELSHQSS